MNLLTSRKSWMLAPAIAVICAALLVVVWAVLEPSELIPLFDNDGHSPVELMTLPLFALIIPMVWLCCPAGGSLKRQIGWSATWSLLGVMAIVRETDLHKMLFAHIWPDVVFKGTVFKMKFLTRAPDIPLMPKLFVLIVFILFFASVMIPLIRYALPLIRGFFRLEPVAWTMATFGAVSVVVLTVDRLPANLRKAGVCVDLLDRDTGTLTSLLKAFEEGGEMVMALLALLAILQAYLIFNRGAKGVES